MKKSIKAFPRLPLEKFGWQWFSIKHNIFSEGGDFLRIIAIALFFFFYPFFNTSNCKDILEHLQNVSHENKIIFLFENPPK